MVSCPAEATFVRYAGGELEADAAHALETHLDGCASCRYVYAELARGTGDGVPAAVPTPPRLGAEPLARGTVVDRYVIVGTLGRGGMGVVYKAFDPELDRSIALKLVGLAGSTDDREQARTRLVREAKTLAQLSHPNIVAVHDVGTHGTDVFVAMELVAGSTLRAWLGERDRTPREILGVFAAAGAGLAAAHRLGIVHRDFKPENVMVGDDGRVRVVDFGLARTLDLAPRTSRPNLARTDAVELTRDGAVLGTPAYMAPEQDLGKDADARSDQFSFCVALYEALFHQRPFAGATYVELSDHRISGEVRPPPNVRGVSAKVRRAVLRGLRVYPADRHPTIDALLGELGTGRWSPRTRATIAVLGATTLAAGSWGVYQAMQPAPTAEAACALAADDITGVWNAKRRADVIASFESIDVIPKAEARAMALRVGELADRWAAEWSKRRATLCEHIVRGDPDPSGRTADQLQCLRSRLDSLDAAISVSIHAPSELIVRRADVIVEEIPWPAGCDEVEEARTAMTEETRLRWKPMLQDLVAARVAQAKGDLAEAERLSTQTLARARAGRDQEPIAAALLSLGQVQAAKGQFEAAIPTLREAIRIATKVRDEGEIVDAWLEIVSIAFSDSRFDRDVEEALFAIELATLRLPADDDRRQQVAYKVGSVRLVRGDLDGAREPLTQALALASRDPDKHRLDIAAVENSIGLYHAYRGEYAEARRHLDRAAATWQQAGATVNLAATLGIIGELAAVQHDFTRAEPDLVRALQLLDEAGDAGRPSQPKALYQLGYVYARTNRCAEARPLFAKIRTVVTEVYGAESTLFSLAEFGDGVCALAEGKPTDAVALLEHARALVIDHPAGPIQIPNIEAALARAIVAARGDRARAVALAQHAREIYAKYPGLALDREALDAWLAEHAK
ncbi:MAG TPA: tetratricopeptide repeat protein [Kofleriaceae bacterium]|nr:tetratricopeptide repeat protein [Kofleriaceae bacterium]